MDAVWMLGSRPSRTEGGVSGRSRSEHGSLVARPERATMLIETVSLARLKVRKRAAKSALFPHPSAINGR
jgi:hypothetical protein